MLENKKLLSGKLSRPPFSIQPSVKGNHATRSWKTINPFAGFCSRFCAFVRHTVLHIHMHSYLHFAGGNNVACVCVSVCHMTSHTIQDATQEDTQRGKR